jgi:hypothetical protein
MLLHQLFVFEAVFVHRTEPVSAVQRLALNPPSIQQYQ